MVCSKDFEPKHPQESVRAKRDKVHVPVARPDVKSGDLLWQGDDNISFGGDDDVGFGDASNGSINYINTPITADDL